MTLAQLIESGDVAGCLAFFLALPARERRAHFEVARGASLAAWSAVLSGLSRSDRVHDATGVALMATATLPELGKLHHWIPAHDVAVEAARSLHPAWLRGWAAALVDDNPRHWLLARRLVREGLCEKPTGDRWILGMQLSWPLHHEPLRSPRRSPRERLEADPELLEDEVWRLFEVEGGGEFSLAAVDKYDPLKWQTSLVDLAALGRLDRGRLLDASLQALARDFAQFRASWYSRFHEAMQPTLEERSARREAYAHLLHSRIPPTVSFALDALAILEKAGLLPYDGLPSALAPAVAAPQKGVALLALGLLGKAGRARPEQAADIARLAVGAMASPSPQVGREAFGLLEVFGDRADVGLKAAVEGHLEAVAPSLRERVRGWCGGAVAREVPLVLQTAPTAGAPLPLAPVADVDELLDLLACVLEDPGRTDDVERALDEVSRLCADPIEVRRLAPLVRRARKLLGSRQPMQRELSRVALAWGAREVVEAGPPLGTLTDLLSRRVTRLAQRVAAARPVALRSFPTHGGGWIEAAATRMGETDEEDVLLARLRSTTWTPSARAATIRFERFGTGGALVRLAVDIVPAPAGEDALLYAGVCRGPQFTWSEMETEAEIRWAATVCPGGMQAFFARSVLEIGINLDWWEARWGDRAYLEPLLGPWTRLGELGTLLLVLGLATKEPGHQRLAVDALIATLDEGRLDIVQASAAMAMLRANDYVKPARWARTLGEAARVSPTHARAVAIILQGSLRSEVTKDMVPFLELLNELSIGLGAEVTDAEARAVLERCTVGGRTGTLCRGLVALAER